MARKFSKLTRLEMRKLTPGEKIVEAGIEFERLPDGDGRFLINIMVDRQRVHRVIGKESEGVTRERCEEAIEKLRTDAREGRLNLPKGRKVAMTFAEASREYLSRLEKEGGKGLPGKRQILSQFLIPFFSDSPILSISTSDIERYKVKRSAEKSMRGGDWVSKQARELGQPRGARVTPVKPATINKELGVLSHLLNMAVEWGWMSNKLAKVKRFRVDNQRIEYLNEEQMERLLDAARNERDPDIHMFILIGLSTGMRKMEILSIRIEHIDFGRNLIYIPEAKAGARMQPFPDSMVLELRRYIKKSGCDQGWLFPSPSSRTGHRMNLEKPFRRAVQAAGLDPRKVIRHTLRHSCISHLVQQGVDLPTVAVISGHRSLQMVHRYAHQDNAHVRSALAKLDERLPTPKVNRERATLKRRDRNG